VGLAAIPGFLASGLAEGLARAGMLAIVSLIYLLRALAEERMVSRDPAYRDYAENVAAQWAGGVRLRAFSRRGP
jgi:protein-S-isoprenylcysteine O-methyltransferase Ste14